MSLILFTNLILSKWFQLVICQTLSGNLSCDFYFGQLLMDLKGMYFPEQNFLQICVPSCLGCPSAIFQLSLMSPTVLLLGEHKQILSPARSGVPVAWVSSSCQVINNV